MDEGKTRLLKPKAVSFPAMRVAAWKLANYRAAWRIMREATGREVSWSEWVREILDDESEAIFQAYGEPTPEQLRIRRG